MGAKERVTLEEKDLVYDNNGTQLYTGVEDVNNSLNNVPLESRALVTEQQLNYLAKDIRDYLDDQNYVAYYEQNPVPAEQENAINNIFGDGRLEAKCANIVKNIQTTAQGVTTLNLDGIGLDELISGNKNVFILTSKAVFGDYGIPIVSEFFKDVTNNEVIYRKDTYEKLRSDDNWSTTYSQVLENNKSGDFNIDNARIKNKYRFAEFSRYDPKYMTGLYDYHKGGSVPAFAEYLPFDWVTFIPKIFENLKEGDILYQPSTGNVFEVTKSQDSVTCNTLVGLQRIPNSNGFTNTYKYLSIYDGSVKDALDNNVFNSDTFKKESYAKRYLMGDDTLAPDEIEEKQTVFDAYAKNYFNHNVVPESEHIGPYFDKDNNHPRTSNYYADFKMINHDSEITMDGSQEKIKSVRKNTIPKTNKSLPKYFSSATNLTNSSGTGWLDSNNNYTPVVNDNTARLFYNTATLNPNIFGENIVKQYPHGAFAIHCKKIGTLNNKVIWKFLGDIIYGGGTEYPDQDVYEKILSSDFSSSNKRPDVGDYIYNPNSTELRRVIRPLTISECGNGRKTYLTEPVYTQIQSEEDGVTRAAGTYLRGTGLKYMTVVNDTDLADATVPDLALTGFFDDIEDVIKSNSKKFNENWPEGIGNSSRELSDILYTQKGLVTKYNKNNIISKTQDNTKVIFNSLYLLPKEIQELYFKKFKDKETLLRFIQLNSFIPGDQIIALTPAIEDTSSNKEVYNYRLYQITKAPYLYDIFSDPENNLNFNFKKLFADFIVYQQNTGEAITLHEAFLRDLFITEIMNNVNNDKKYYNYKKGTSSYAFPFGIYNRTENMTSTNKITEWFKNINNSVSDKNFDISIISSYAESEQIEYINSLKYRLLNNYKCPIAVNAIHLTDLKFSGKDGGLVQGESFEKWVRDHFGMEMSDFIDVYLKGKDGNDGQNGLDGRNGTTILDVNLALGSPINNNGEIIPFTQSPTYFRIYNVNAAQTEEEFINVFNDAHIGDMIVIGSLLDEEHLQGSYPVLIHTNAYVKIISEPVVGRMGHYVDVKILHYQPTATELSQEDIDRVAAAWASENTFTGKNIYSAEIFGSNLHGGNLVIDNDLTYDNLSTNGAISGEGTIKVQKDGELLFQASTDPNLPVYIKGKVDIENSNLMYISQSQISVNNNKTLIITLDSESQVKRANELLGLYSIGSQFKISMPGNNEYEVQKVQFKKASNLTTPLNNLSNLFSSSDGTAKLISEKIGGDNEIPTIPMTFTLKSGHCYFLTLVQAKDLGNSNFLTNCFTIGSNTNAIGTIIDGGSITTGTIDANLINANELITVINNNTGEETKISAGKIEVSDIVTNVITAVADDTRVCVDPQVDDKYLIMSLRHALDSQNPPNIFMEGNKFVLYVESNTILENVSRLKIKNQDTVLQYSMPNGTSTNYCFLTNPIMGKNNDYSAKTMTLTPGVYTFTIVKSTKSENHYYCTVEQGNLSSTIIDADSITTGTLSADRLNVNDVIQLINKNGTTGTKISADKIETSQIITDVVNSNELQSQILEISNNSDGIIYCDYTNFDNQILYITPKILQTVTSLSVVGTQFVVKNTADNKNINFVYIWDATANCWRHYRITKNLINTNNNSVQDYKNNRYSFKINEGYYTFTLVAKDGDTKYLTVSSGVGSNTTIIDGGSIKTGSITADHVVVDNSLIAKFFQTENIEITNKINDTSGTNGAGLKVGKGSTGTNTTNGIMLYQNTTDKDKNPTNKYNLLYISNTGIRMSLNGSNTGGQGKIINLYLTESNGLVIQSDTGHIFNLQPNGTISINNGKMIIEGNGNVCSVYNNVNGNYNGVRISESDVRLISNGITSKGNIIIGSSSNSNQITVGSNGFEFKNGAGEIAHFTIEKLQHLATL